MKNHKTQKKFALLLAVGACIATCGCATQADSVEDTPSVETENSGEIMDSDETIPSSEVLEEAKETLHIETDAEAEEEANSILSGLVDNYNKAEDLTRFPELSAVAGEVDGYTYYAMAVDDIESIADVEVLFGKVYTRETAEEKLSKLLDLEVPILREIDGELCTLDAYSPGTPFVLPVSAAQKISEDEILVQAASVDEESTYVVMINLQREDGQWKIREIYSIDK